MIKRAKPTEKQKAAKEAKKIIAGRLRALYQEIWKERPHNSEVDGQYLGNTIKTYFFHHILPKNSCPQMMYSKNNIILLTAEQHGKVENDENAFEEINRRRDELLRNLLHYAGIIVKQ
jgi:hypothetical protein